VTVHDGRVNIDGIGEMVDAQLAAAQQQLDHATGLSPDLRARVQKRLDAARKRMAKRLRNLRGVDFEKLGEELGRMGEELGKEMEELGEEMEEMGEQMGHHFAGPPVPPTPPRPPVPPTPPRADDNDEDLPDVELEQDDSPDVRDLGDLSLSQQQRLTLAKIRADAKRQLEDAKRELARAEKILEGDLANVSIDDRDLERAIDQVSAQEAAIRRARIIQWVKARRVLDADQRRRVEQKAASVKSR
jgi:hypothetical protein